MNTAFQTKWRHRSSARKHMIRGIALLCCTTLLAQVVDQLIEQGFFALQTERFQESFNKFTEAKEQEPELAEIDAYLGLALFKMERYEDALEKFDTALLRDTSIKDSSLLFYRSSALRALGLGAQELEAWRDVVEWDEDSEFAQVAKKELQSERISASEDVLVARGLSNWRERPHTAAAYFLEALALEEINEQDKITVYLASSLNKAGRYAEVTQLSEPPGLRDRWKPMWSVQQGIALMAMGEWGTAEGLLAQVPKESQLTSEAEVLQALCLIQQGDTKSAQQALN